MWAEVGGWLARWPPGLKQCPPVRRRGRLGLIGLVGLAGCLSAPARFGDAGIAGGGDGGPDDAADARPSAPCPAVVGGLDFVAAELGEIDLAAAGPIDDLAAGDFDDLVLAERGGRLFVWSSADLDGGLVACTTLAELGSSGRVVALAAGEIADGLAGIAAVVRQPGGSATLLLLEIDDEGAIEVHLSAELGDVGDAVVVQLIRRGLPGPQVVVLGSTFAWISTVIESTTMAPAFDELFARQTLAGPPVAVVAWTNLAGLASDPADVTAVWQDEIQWRHDGDATLASPVAPHGNLIAGAFVDAKDDDCVDFVAASTSGPLWVKSRCATDTTEVLATGSLPLGVVAAAPVRLPAVDDNPLARNLVGLSQTSADSYQLDLMVDLFGDTVLSASGVSVATFAMTNAHLMTGDFFEVVVGAAGADEILAIGDGGAVACYFVSSGDQLMPCPLSTD